MIRVHTDKKGNIQEMDNIISVFGNENYDIKYYCDEPKQEILMIYI